MSGIAYQKDSDAIVTLVIDVPGAPVNTLNAAFQADMAAALDRLEAEREMIRGVIITSGKSSFFAGGDLRALLTVTSETATRFFAEVTAIKANLRRIEKLGRPVVAAINGSALGGGLELALACHRRICLDAPRTEIGFPEVTLGLIPGGGGIVRSVRMLGLQAALPFLLEGKRMDPSEALAAGFVDALAPNVQDMLTQARAWIGANPAPVQRWDDPKHRIPGGSPASPAVAAVLPVAAAMLAQKTHGNYPAPAAVLAVAVEGAQVDFDTALRIESRYMTRVTSGQVAKNMIGTLFFQLNELKSGAGRPDGIARSQVGKVGVLGAGMMGAGIAWACASRSLPCVLIDTTLEAAERGKEHTAELLARRVSKGRISAAEASGILDRISPSADVGDLADCDLVIEAVFEKRELKDEVLRAADRVAGAGAVLASNTSTLPISGLAASCARPEQFIGLHFFSPVERMQLVEIIKGRTTSAQTLARAYDFVLQIGKTPIVVNDSRGFYTSRVFGSYVNEGMALLGDGVPAALIENLGEQAGMPTGPLAVLDEVSLKLADDILHQELADLAAAQKAAIGHEHGGNHAHDHGHEHGDGHAHEHDHARCTEHAHHGSHAHGSSHHSGSHAPVKSRRVPASAVYVLEKMSHGFRRLGRAHGAGFYDYPAGGKKALWEGLDAFRRGSLNVPADDIRDRLLYAQSIETLRCLDEGIIESHRDANIGAIFGWGFPAWTGGTVQFVNHVGTVRFVARANELAERYGERFAPPEWVVQRAAEGLAL